MKVATEKIKKTYQDRFHKFGVDARSLQWASKGAAHQRFRQFWAEVDYSNKTVLDVGCGFGEFGNFLSKRYEGVLYKGVDIVPEFITTAERLYPHLTFEVKDYLNDEIDQTFDIVVASGIINSNVENNMEYRKEAIKKLFSLSKGVCIFNMLGAHPQPETKKDSNVWYADSLEILEYCMTLTPRVVLRQNYHPRDFTISLYKNKKSK